jgi:hypothetical protein
LKSVNSPWEVGAGSGMLVLLGLIDLLD